MRNIIREAWDNWKQNLVRTTIADNPTIKQELVSDPNIRLVLEDHMLRDEANIGRYETLANARRNGKSSLDIVQDLERMYNSMSEAIDYNPLKDIPTGTGLTRPVTKELVQSDRFATYSNRTKIIKDVQKMTATDTRVTRMLKKLASDSTVGSFVLLVDKAPSDTIKKRADEILRLVRKRTRMDKYLRGWKKALLRDGDIFLEKIVDDPTREIVRIKKLATIITHSNMDEEGNFPKDKSAYYQSTPWSMNPIRTFEPWQITHIAWEEEEGNSYGESMFMSARLPWERLQKEEQSLVVRRLLRSGRRRHHMVGSMELPGTPIEVTEYREKNKDTLDNPLDPSQDFFSNGRVKIDDLQGDTGLGDMEDIKHFEKQVILPSGIPRAFLGQEESINRDVLEEQEEDYYRVIDDLNGAMEYALREIFDFALLLQDIDPETIQYTIKWGARDRSDTKDKIQMAKDLQTLALPFKVIVSALALEDWTYETIIEAIKEQVDENVIPYGVGFKLDPATIQFLSGLMASNQAQQIGVKPTSETVEEKRQQIINLMEHPSAKMK